MIKNLNVIAKVTITKNKGSAFERQDFTRNKEYEYCTKESFFNHRTVVNNNGDYNCFNEKQFTKYFSLIK